MTVIVALAERGILRATSCTFRPQNHRNQRPKQQHDQEVEWSALVETYCKWRLSRCRVASSERESRGCHVTAVSRPRDLCLAVTWPEKLLSKGHVTSHVSWWVTQLPRSRPPWPPTRQLRVRDTQTDHRPRSAVRGRRSTVRSSARPGRDASLLVVQRKRDAVSIWQ